MFLQHFFSKNNFISDPNYSILVICYCKNHQDLKMVWVEVIQSFWESLMISEPDRSLLITSFWKGAKKANSDLKYEKMCYGCDWYGDPTPHSSLQAGIEGGGGVPIWPPYPPSRSPLICPMSSTLFFHVVSHCFMQLQNNPIRDRN